MSSPTIVLKLLRPLLLVVAISAGILTAPVVAAATYGYAPTTYSWVDNTAHTDVTWAHGAGCSGGWVGANADDDISTQIALPFTFTFGATAYSYVQIMSNGRLQFVASAATTSYCGYGTQTVGPPPTYPYPYPNANLNNSMRLYGADLCPAGGGAGCAGRVTYQSLGVAPYRTFVVTWSQMREWNSGASLFNMQVVLHENGDFVYQYKNVANYSLGTGQIGWQLSVTDYDLVDLTSISSLAYSAIRFYKPTAPIAEYRLDECSANGANSVLDSGPNGLHGQPIGGGGVTPGGTGKVCSAYRFNGSNGYVRVNHAAILNQPKVSVAAWAQHSADPLKNWEAILAKGDSTYRLHLNGGCSISPSANGYTTAKAFTFGFNGGCGNADLNSGIVPVAGQWYHVVGTYDGVTIKIFVNGVLANSAALATTIGTNTYDLNIGENSQATGRNWSGNIDEVKIFDRALPDNEVYSMYLNESAGLQRDGTIRTCAICNASIGRFNAYESSLPVSTVTGPIKTKIAGRTFAASSGTVAIVAINAATAVDTSSNRPARVEFWDASNETGSPDSDGCYTTSGAAFYTQNITLSSGRFVLDPTTVIPQAYKRVRIKVVDTGSGGANGNKGCATDLFAIRPAHFDATAAEARDNDWQTAGVARTLASGTTSAAANAGVTANTDRVHAAGRPFSVSGLVAKNGAASPVTTTTYDGQPTLIAGSLILPDPNVCITCAPGVFAVGSWIAASGALSTNTATYSEVGSFSWEAEDRSFASVDASDSTKLQRYFRTNRLISTGRFVPDSFLLTPNTPTLQTFGAADGSCSAAAAAPKRSFTYLGQPFGYATAPSIGVAARNFAGATTVNYQGTPGSGGLWRLATPLASSSVACTQPTQTCAMTRQDGAARTRLLSTYALGAVTPGWDGSQGTVANVTITSNSNGTGTMAYGADKLVLYRNPTTPQAAYTAAITLAVQLDDISEAAVAGNPAAITGSLAATAVPFDTAPVGVLTGEFRYGVLRTQSNYGSELLDLPIAVQTLYWNGASLVQNAADNCTPLVASNIALANYQGSLSAVNLGASHVVITTPITAGAGVITLTKPTGGARGSVDTVVNLGSTGAPANCPNYSTAGSTSAAMRYLSGNWCGANYDRDPTGRATFGSTRTPLIYRKENF
jgi:hypothetical protein